MTAVTPTAPNRDPLAWLTLTAAVLLLAVVAARATVNELTGDGNAFAGPIDAGSGPTTTIALNALCVLPTLLVLVRRAIDPAYVLRWHASYGLAIAVAIWITGSAAWAGNPFDALLAASTGWAGVSVLWASGQLVRSWTRLRAVLAVPAGLLMVFVAQALVYRFYELGNLQAYWATDPAVAAARAGDVDSFTAAQMARTIAGGAQLGFFRSPNTFAAIAVLTATVTAGFVGQRLLSARNKDDRDAFALPAAAAFALPVIGLPLILYWTGSRTAAAVAALAAIALAAAWSARSRLAARSRAAYAAGVGVAVFGVVAVVGVGLSTGGLLHDSLNFRWNYWRASAKLVEARPLLGVGWTNFGPAYLGVRLPAAAEEIRDPHNVFVRFATETGVIGLALVVAWLAVALWEATRPVAPRTTAASPQSWARPALAVAVVFFVARMVVQWPMSAADAELGKTVLFALLLLAAGLLATARDKPSETADDRPAPFLVYATVVGLLAFLLHNQVDFPASETAPLLVFMLTLGGLLGVRHPGVAGKRANTAAAVGGLAGVALVLVAAAGLWAVPVAIAEAKAAAGEAKGNEAMRLYKDGREEAAQSVLREAADAYREAIAASPVPNPAYARRGIRWAGNDPPAAIAFAGQALTANPADPQAWLDRARVARQVNGVTPAVLADYAHAVSLNPNNVPVRIEYADALDAAGERTKAAAEFVEALSANERLDEREPRRLKPTEVDRVRQRLGRWFSRPLTSGRDDPNPGGVSTDHRKTWVDNATPQRSC